MKKIIEKELKYVARNYNTYPLTIYKGKDIFKVIGTDLWEGHGSSSLKDSDGYPTHLQDSNYDKK